MVVQTLIPQEKRNKTVAVHKVAIPVSFLDWLLDNRCVSEDFIDMLRQLTPAMKRVQRGVTEDFLKSWDNHFDRMPYLGRKRHGNDLILILASSDGSEDNVCVVLPTLDSALEYAAEHSIGISMRRKVVEWEPNRPETNEYWIIVSSEKSFRILLNEYQDYSFFDESSHAKAARLNCNTSIAMLGWMGIWQDGKVIYSANGPYRMERSRDDWDLDFPL